MEASQFIYTFGNSLVYINTILTEKLLATTADQHKDIGIIISSNLTFSLHYETISAKAYKMLGLLRTAFETHSTLVKKNCILV